jgi:hypothetical protein
MRQPDFNWYYCCSHLKILCVKQVVIAGYKKLEITVLGWPSVDHTEFRENRRIGTEVDPVGFTNGHLPTEYYDLRDLLPVLETKVVK